MREMADITETQFFLKYGEVSRAISYLDRRSDDVAAEIFSLCKRNGESRFNGLFRMR
jgi:hypothetical protein